MDPRHPLPINKFSPQQWGLLGTDPWWSGWDYFSHTQELPETSLLNQKHSAGRKIAMTLNSKDTQWPALSVLASVLEVINPPDGPVPHLIYLLDLNPILFWVLRTNIWTYLSLQAVTALGMCSLLQNSGLNKWGPVHVPSEAINPS